MRKIHLIAFVTLVFHLNAFGQADANIDMLVQDTKSDLMIVVGGGLAGAVLGLSTLSFVEEPKDHTRNIIVGASVGIIVGVAYVALSQASRTQNMMYGEEGEEYSQENQRDFGTFNRLAWHQQEHAQFKDSGSSAYSWQWNLLF